MKVVKLLGLLGILSLSCLLMPNTVKAAPTVYESGDCNVTIDGTSMIIEKKEGVATGNMASYSGSFSDVAPWKDFLPTLTSITIDDSVDMVGKNCIVKAGSDVEGGLKEFNCPNKDDLKWVDLGLNAPNLDIVLYGTYIDTEKPRLNIVAKTLTVNFSKQLVLSDYNVNGLNLLVTADKLVFNCATDLNSQSSPIGNNVRVITFNKPFTSSSFYFFKNAKKLEVVEISSEQTILSGSLFENCTNLKSVGINSKDGVYLPNITEISSSSFKGCTSLKSVYLPNVVTLGDSVFNGCTALVFVDIPKAKVGENCFWGCSSLSSIKIGNSVGKRAFVLCSNLAYVEILDSENKIDIGFESFANLSNLKTIKISNAVTSILSGAFKCEMSTNTDLYTDNLVAKNYNWVSDLRQITLDSTDAAPAPTYNITINISIAFPNGLGSETKISWDMVNWEPLVVDGENIQISVPEGTTEFYLKSGTTIVTIKLTNNGASIGGIITEEDVSNGGESVDSTEPTDSTVEVDYSKKSSFKVRIPSKLHIIDDSGAVAYKVGVQGNIEAGTQVSIVPKDAIEGDEGISFYMENGKGSQINTKVSLAKQHFLSSEIVSDSWTYGNGDVKMTEIKPGSWKGKFILSVSLGDVA